MTEKEASEAEANERREIFFRGRVQGVGFRQTTMRVSQRFAVSGFVENLPDGRVRLVCEGRGDELERFITDVSAELDLYISDTLMNERSATGEFSRFEIRY